MISETKKGHNMLPPGPTGRHKGGMLGHTFERLPLCARAMFPRR